MKKIKWETAGQAAMLILAVIVIFFACIKSSQSSSVLELKVSFQGEYKIADGEWQPIEKGRSISAMEGDVTLKGYFQLEIPEGEVLGRAQEGTQIALYFNHIGAEIFINGECTHVFDAENRQIAEDICGTYWIVYEYTGTDTDTVEIVLKNPHSFGNYNAVNEFLNFMYIYSDETFENNMVAKGNVEYTVGMAIIIVAFVVFGIAAFSSLQRTPLGINIWLIGIVDFFAGGYFILDSPNIELRNDAIAFNNTARLLCMILYAFFTMYLIVECLSEKARKIGRLASAFSAVTTAVLLIISLLGGMVLYDACFYWAAIQIIVGAVLLGCCIYSFKGAQGIRILLLAACVLAIAAAFADMLGTSVGWWQGGFVSKAVFLLFFIMALVYMFMVIPANFHSAKQAKQMADELQENRISIMLSQIQPYFLYNALNSIYYLCDIDKNAAQKAIANFSDYLRGNMESLTRTSPVTFSAELKNLKAYLSLEKMRFDDMLEVEYDIQTESFMLPALTIQPLVENAVKHGICQAPNGGTVRISTRECSDCYEVEISDNGVGFDVNQIKNDGKRHVGIENTGNRLRSMCSASLEITSELGKGTTAIIRIPKEDKSV